MSHYDIAFIKFDQVVLFLHVCFVALFVGLQAGLVLVGSYFIKNKFEDKERYHILLHIIRRFGIAIFILILCVIATSVVIIFGFYDADLTNPMASAMVATKCAIELFLLLNLSYIFYRYKKALKALRSHEMIELNESLIVIIYYFTPLNLLASLAAIYLGISYKVFL
ncbi:3-isopropylmalate dehydratase [Campylobacter concisus]|uniref:3-isopropylmalate dehydratase n=1 Tax=Campylobacter concisus TaxID=199 RepID=UPI000D311D84|nr:3-isopropylmalate dehydratase [Campylobacter concisus]